MTGETRSGGAVPASAARPPAADAGPERASATSAPVRTGAPARRTPARDRKPGAPMGDPTGGPTGEPAGELAAEPAGPPAGGQLRAAFRLAAPAIGIYLLLRALSMGVLVWFAVNARSRGVANFQFYDGSTNSWRGWESPIDLLLIFDGRWYTMLAAEGYGPEGLIDSNNVPYNNRLAFFPLYPWLIRIVARITFLPVTGAALVVSLLASIAAAWALFAIGNHLRGPRVGIMLAAMWALFPEGITQHGGFTESVFVAFSGWALYAVLKREWLAAGAITAFGGLTRPTAVALVGTVGLAALVAVLRREDGWAPYAAGALSPLGYVGYLLYAGDRLGRPDGFFHLQRTWWDSYFDWGHTTVQDLQAILLGDPERSGPVFAIAAVTVLAVVPLFAFAALYRTHWVLLVFAAVVAIGSLGSHAHFSTLPRHLLPAFPLLMAPAIAMAAARTRDAALLLVFLALFAGWYGAWVPLSSAHVV